MRSFIPHVTVAAVIADNHRFLLVEESNRIDPSDERTVFNQPAGHLEAGESLLAAMQRETLEESGWRVIPESYLGLYINTAPNGVVYHSHTFIARPEQQVTRTLDEGIMGADWFTLEEIQTLEQAGRLRSPLVARRICDALAGHRYPLSLICDLDHPAMNQASKR